MEIPKFEDIFKQIRTNLRLSGIPFDDSPLGFKFYIPFLALSLMMVEELCFFVSRISDGENFLELTALAPCIGIGLLSIAKIFAIALKRRKIFRLTDHLGQLYQDILSEATKKVLVSKEIKLVQSLTKNYFILNAILISVYNFSTLLLMLYDFLTKGEVVFSLPYAVIVPFSINSWAPWLVVYIHSVLCGFICVLYYTTVDALYCNLSSHVCSNFTIISNEIENLEATTTVQTLGEIIEKHQFILKLCEDLEEIFTAPNLFNVLVGSVEICALGFNIMAGDWSGLPGYILFLLSEILQILVMSVFGENIIRGSKRVGDAAFLCEWYEMDQKCKKMILILMIRTQKPSKLTAYKFSTICYESFTKIISTSWSYFTILRTVYKPSEVVVAE